VYLLYYSIGFLFNIFSNSFWHYYFQSYVKPRAALPTWTTRREKALPDSPVLSVLLLKKQLKKLIRMIYPFLK
jgi:hypothetical protein